MDGTDTYIRKRLKAWAWKQQSPENGRERLLNSVQENALSRTYDSTYLVANKRGHHEYRPNLLDWSNGLFDWITLYSFKTGMVNMRLLL